MNVLSAIGRTGKQPELRTTNSGTTVLSCSLAVDSGWGENKQTTWLDCSLFGKRADSLGPYINKGDQLGITGEISLESWADREGKERQTLRCRVNDVTLISNKSDQASTNDNSSQSTVYAGSGAPGGGGDNFTNDVIPF